MLAHRLRDQLHHEMRVCAPLHKVLLISSQAVSRQLSSAMDQLHLHTAQMKRARVHDTAVTDAALVNVAAGTSLLAVLMRRRLAATWRRWAAGNLGWEKREVIEDAVHAIGLSEAAGAALAALHAVADPYCSGGPRHGPEFDKL